jgi:hypothetical protein
MTGVLVVRDIECRGQRSISTLQIKTRHRFTTVNASRNGAVCVLLHAELPPHNANVPTSQHSATYPPSAAGSILISKSVRLLVLHALRTSTTGISCSATLRPTLSTGYSTWA